jgi:hypothetical protein
MSTISNQEFLACFEFTEDTIVQAAYLIDKSLSNLFTGLWKKQP